jgi:5,10-methylenetetrahydrofolate reductase
LTQRLKIFSKFRNVCKKCERGVKVGIVIGSILVEESKKPQFRQKFIQKLVKK